MGNATHQVKSVNLNGRVFKISFSFLSEVTSGSGDWST